MSQRSSSTSDRVRQFVTIAATVFMIICNLVIGAGALFSGEGGAISSANQDGSAVAGRSFIEPAEYGLSIWSIIYFGLIVYTVYQALPAQRENAIARRIGWLYIVNAVANGIWMLGAINNSLITTVVTMWIMLVTLVLIIVRIGVGENRPAGRDYWRIAFPFSLYFGWIALATIVNTSSFLREDLGLTQLLLTGEAWAVILIVVALALGVWVTLRLKLVPFGFVVAWGLGAIAVGNSDVGIVAIAATVGSLASLAISLYAVVQDRLQPPRQPVQERLQPPMQRAGAV